MMVISSIPTSEAERGRCARSSASSDSARGAVRRSRTWGDDLNRCYGYEPDPMP
jgi:hypothetical protein